MAQSSKPFQAFDTLTDQQPATVAELEMEKPTLRLRDLCRLTGFSKGKFLADIDRGTLVVTAITTGRTKRYLVAKEEAARYLQQIGYLPD